MHDHTPVYRPLLARAFATAWRHRELWPIAALASFAGLGTVLNDVISQGDAVVRLSHITYTDVINVGTALAAYGVGLTSLAPHEAVASTLILLTLLALFSGMVVAAQYTILDVVHRAASKKAHLPGWILWRDLVHPRFLRLFSINLLTKIVVLNLFFGATATLMTLRPAENPADLFFGAIFSLTVFFLALTLNILGMYSAISVVKDNSSLFSAFQKAWFIFSSHPGVALEMAASLFGIDIAASVLHVIMLVLIIGPALFIIGLVLGTGSTMAFLITGLISLVLIVTLTVTITGFVTTISYSAWTELYLTLLKKPFAPRLHLHLHRLLKRQHHAR